MNGLAAMNHVSSWFGGGMCHTTTVMQVVLEIDDPSHFAVNTWRPLGSTIAWRYGRPASRELMRRTCAPSRPARHC